MDALRARMRITCADATTLLTDYDEEALSPEDRGRLDDHLALCQACGAFLDQLRATTTALAKWGADQRSSAPPSMGSLLDMFRLSRDPQPASGPEHPGDASLNLAP